MFTNTTAHRIGGCRLTFYSRATSCRVYGTDAFGRISLNIADSLISIILNDAVREILTVFSLIYN